MKQSLDKEIKNLIIYKKALFNSDFVNENDLLKILSPIINSESIWKVTFFIFNWQNIFIQKGNAKS